MKRFVIEVSTNWCGEDNKYGAYAENEDELYEIADELAYENFSDFGGFDAVLEDMYPNVEEENYTEEMIDDAMLVENEYYSSFVYEWDESNPEEEWHNLQIIYDKRTDNELKEND